MQYFYQCVVLQLFQMIIALFWAPNHWANQWVHQCSGQWLTSRGCQAVMSKHWKWKKLCMGGAIRVYLWVYNNVKSWKLTFNFSWTVIPARWAQCNISVWRVLSCGMSFSARPGWQYLISWQKLPCLISWNASRVLQLKMKSWAQEDIPHLCTQ